jgi:DMSO/TMAO reductase YedYZ molybdopterin-dependent catalytic subunit
VAKNRTKIFLIALVAVVVVSTFSLTLLYSYPTANGQLPSGEQPQAHIKILGDVERERSWTSKEIAALPFTNVTVKLNGSNETYLGVPFNDFCNRSGIRWDVGPIEIVSTDGSKATVNIFQVYNSSAYPYYYNSNVIMLAFARNGQWLTSETGGPLKFVAPYFPAECQIENVAEIHFKPWTISISGMVENTVTLTENNLATFPQRTVYAEFAPSEKRWSNWTGIPILDILEAANMSKRAEKITITAIDGYQKNYTLQQIEEGQMMIGYSENNSPLPLDQGGPFRLFAPTEKYKWAQFWVKFVLEIIVY